MSGFGFLAVLSSRIQVSNLSQFTTHVRAALANRLNAERERVARSPDTTRVRIVLSRDGRSVPRSDAGARSHPGLGFLNPIRPG